ncbi:hypothetical protein QTH90_23885 [Variovorax sp. J2P1-59]|uniref:hypothetical protein n=1 Tax=Variovorax flavidus TaxID=3053501 RepID=UPI00257770AE|nr:hypothetical protein [Variovorax sp. J2P1-59]MDM0077468.1 hypothetical protein [Variovorax sp. J2P1-59]
MEAGSILELLRGLGFTVMLGAGDGLLVGPASALRENERQLLRANKAEIVTFLKEADRVAAGTTADLLEAAMAVCDYWGDGEEARAEMRADCLATPLHLRADLLEHFRWTYGVRLQKRLRCGVASRPSKSADP